MPANRVVASDVTSAELLSGLQEWRVAHPAATFAEIEAAVEERLDRLRAQWLQELALAHRAVDGSERPAPAVPLCPACQVPLAPRGTRTRALTVQGNQPVTLTRRYWVCPACGAGLFPPG